MRIARLAGGAIAVILATVLMMVPVGAESVATGSVRLAPLRTSIEVDPGQSRTVKMTVTNPSEQPITFDVVYHDFIAEGEDGTPALVLDGQAAGGRSLRQFVAPLEPVTVPAKGSAVVEVVLNISPHTSPGVYFGAIRFVPSGAVGEGQVSMSVSAASLLLVRVNGDVPERLSLTDFALLQGEAERAFLQTDDHLSVRVRFANEGGVQLVPTGQITVQKGDAVILEARFNDKEQQDMILPDSARRWNVPVGELDGFGKYTITGIFTYGSDNQTIEVTKTVWFVPRELLLAAGVGVVVLLAVGVSVVLRIRRHKQDRQLRRRRPRHR